jgi:hypothetical protein
VPDPQAVPFGEWRPDLSDRANPAGEARGVISSGGQYAPLKDMQNYNGADAATATACLGGATFYDSDTTPHIFLGDAAKLWHLESRVAVDRSIAGGYALGTTDGWRFAQFGDNVVAVARSHNPQLFDMSSPAAFTNLGGSPPQFTTAARVNDFLWGAIGFTAYWSAFNDITDWTPDPGTQAGNQQLDQEQGLIQQIIGLDFAAVFQERAIRRAIYVGPPVIWDFGQDYVEKARGAISRNACDVWGKHIYYVADDGFYVFDGQASTPIGESKVDDYFVRNLNYAYRDKVVGVCVNKLFVVGFPAGSATRISELLIFSIKDGRWTHEVIDLEHLMRTPVEPLTVDNFHTLYSDDDLDATDIVPDDIDSATFDDRRQLMAGVDTSHRLNTFTGPNRAAVLDTGEFEISPGQRSKGTELWPMGDFTDGAAISACIGSRAALPGDMLTFSNPTAMNRVGFCPQRVDGRFMRARLLLAAGAAWRRMEGVQYTARRSGRR